MAVSFVAYAWNQFGAVADFINSLNVTLPSSIQAGDLLLGVSVSENHADTPAPPSGWTTLDLQGFGTSDLSQDILVAYKVAEASDAGATVTWTYDPGGVRSVVVHIAVYRGVDATTPIAAWANTGKQTGSSITCPSVTVSSARSGSAVVRLLSGRDGGATTFASGLTQRFSDAGGMGIFPSRNAAADAPWDGSATVNASTVTLANSTVGMAAYTLVLNAGTTALTLTGTAYGSSWLGGGILTPRRLTGLAMGMATSRAAVTVTRGVSAAGVGMATASGMIARLRQLAGAASGVAGSRGDVTVFALSSFAGTAIGTTLTSGAFIRPHALGGTAAGATHANATLLVIHTLSARGISVTVVTGVPVAQRRLSGTANGTAILSGDVGVTRAFSGGATGASAVRGLFLVVHGLRGTATGVAFASAVTTRWEIEGALEGLGSADATLFEFFTGVLEGLGITNVVGVIAAEAVGTAIGDGLAVVFMPTESLVLSADVRLEPGDLVWVVAPLAGLNGRSGLCRVLAVEHDADRGEARYQVQLIEMSRIEDVQALNELGRPRVAVNRTTSLARQLREAKRGQR